MNEQSGDNCPYCGEKMQHGFISGKRYQLRWMPESEKEGRTIFNSGKGIPLNNMSLFRSHAVQAYYCENCHKVIIDTNFID